MSWLAFLRAQRELLVRALHGCHEVAHDLCGPRDGSADPGFLPVFARLMMAIDRIDELIAAIEDDVAEIVERREQ